MYSDDDYNDISEDIYIGYTDDQTEDMTTDTSQEISSAYQTDYDTDDQTTIMLNDEHIVINNDMLAFFNKLFNHVDERNNEFSQIFTSDVLEEFNNKKHFTEKHTKYSIDRYGLLIRENKYNNHTDACGWVFDNNEPTNIHVSSELKQTKSPDEIFDIVMSELVRRKKLNITSKSIPTQIFKLIGRNVDKWMTQ